jgi:hypothetical protein
VFIVDRDIVPADDEEALLAPRRVQDNVIETQSTASAQYRELGVS